MTARPPGSRWHLALATASFAVCFAAWGLVGALAPLLRELFRLSAQETALLVAVPVLLGSLARIPMGLLADRLGARPVFTALMLVVAGVAAALPFASTYGALLGAAFCLGLAGSSFSVGTGYVARWTPPEKQGAALGVYGAGNIGQSIAVFFAPVLAASLSWPAVFRGAAALLLVWAVVFGIFARDAPAPAGPAPGLGSMLRLLATERLAWVLSAFYFLTFGGFVAFGIYLPTLLKSEFRLAPADAGARAAGFVVLATLMRPIGGWLADRIGGARVLAGVFFGVVPFGLLLTWSQMLPFTVGALGCAALLGLGNGAVFKLVGQHFPGRTGTVSGLVGAMGGLGGFFPPLLLGAFKERFGVVWPGFLLLVATAAALGVVNQRVFLSRREAEESALPVELRRAAEQLRAGAWATLAAGILCAAIVVGSRNLQNFDPALVVYTFATVFATWGIAYHYHVWIQKPPTRIYWRRGFQIASRSPLRSAAELARLAFTHLFAQTFIAKRSRLRWWMHQLVFWGCLLGVAVTFPLVFGWVHFRTAPSDQERYVAYLFGLPAGSFRLGTPFAWLVFHLLDVAAVLVLAGIALSLWRRMRDEGARALQDFGRDFLPLVILFAISLTGLALTVSTLFLAGSLYVFLSLLHAVTVVAGLLYLPFGKLFHVFQRPAQLGVKLYQRAGDEGPPAPCPRCGTAFASRLHVDDLAEALEGLGFDYRVGTKARWHELCPACKRKSVAGAQLRLKEETLG